MSALRTLAVGVVFIAVIAAACGGGDSDAGESGATDAPATTTTAPATPQTTEAAGTTEAPQPTDTPGATEAPGATESTATVTVDGASYVFASTGPAATCNPDFFGGFLAVLYSADLAASFSVELWNEGAGDGEQIPAARMKVEADGETLDLEADPDMSWPAAEAGTSYVGDFTYESNRAEGTIYFINTEVAYDASLAPLDPLVAEFEVVCADG